MSRINKINGPTSTIKIVLDNPSLSVVEKYDPEVAVDGVTRFLEEIGVSYVLVDPNTINIPQVYDRIVYFNDRFHDYKKTHPELSHVGIQFT